MKILRRSLAGMKFKCLPLALGARGSLPPSVNSAFAQIWTQTTMLHPGHDQFCHQRHDYAHKRRIVDFSE